MELKKEPSNTLIYVSNLPFDTTDEQFKELFKGFNAKTAYVARRKNGKSKGFGFANLEKESEQKAAIEKINGKELDSRKLIAKIAFNDDRRNENGELREEFKNQLTSNSTPSETVVHVSNLEWTVKDEDLKKIFEEFNPKVATVATRRSGRSKGFGFVEFNTKEDQEKALKLNGSAISGRNITVQVSTGYKKNSETSNNNNNRSNNRFGNRRFNNDNNRRFNNDNNRRFNDNDNNKGFNVVRRNDRNDRNDRSERSERKSENTLYISNLPFELDDNDLKQIFAEFTPKNAHIPLRRNGKSKGYGFVEFGNSKDQNEALRALDQSEVNGRVVTIKLSTPNRVTVRRNDNRSYNNDNRSNNNRSYNNDNRSNTNRSYNSDNNNNNNNRRFNDNNRSRNFGNNNNNNDNRRRVNFRNNDNNNTINRQSNTNNENREVSPNMVYISNLPFAVDDKGLEEIFKGLKITKAYIAKRRNGYSKGFGFVEFASPEDQQKAIKYNSNEVNGRAIVVQAAFKIDNNNNKTN